MKEFLSNYTYIINIIIIALVCVALCRIVKYTFNRAVKKKELHKKFIVNIVTAAIYIVGIMAILNCIPGASSITQAIITSSGLIAIVAGLAAQESFGNVISGWFISMFKPFEVGDRVVLSQYSITGIVEDINLRHTIIKTFINSRVIIPNSIMNSAVIENSSYKEAKASSFIDICVAYETNIRKAMSIIADIVGNHPDFLDTRTEEAKTAGDPKVPVRVRELGESGIWLRCSMWTVDINKNFNACSDCRLQIKEAFDKEGIEIPYNKMVISNLNQKQEGERDNNV